MGTSTSRKVAFVLGGAESVWSDIESARSLLAPSVIVCVNDIGVDYPGIIHHWVSYHGDLLSRLVEKRRNFNLPDAKNLWTGLAKTKAAPREAKQHRNKGGSSGLMATWVALDDGSTHVILCGVPIDPKMRHYHDRDRGVAWKEATKYHKHWRDSVKRFDGRVRSCSGWTKDLLGPPTREWLGL